ncbi:MAG: DUF1592 domain-containing protein [Pirellulaceae bacterium]|nr:DUF1592 domain-containing protein [Pirellulaceae bacterium]
MLAPRLCLTAAAAGIVLGLLTSASFAQLPATKKPKIEPAKVYAERVMPALKRLCYDCHGPDLQEAEIGFHDYQDFAKVTGDERTWTRVLQMIETGVMPPEDSPQPTDAERKELVKDLERVLFNVDCDGPVDPGRVTIRRLNRAEYNNTVRDLLGVTFRPADDFPSDDVGSGFDNIGEVLTLPPLLMEKYLAAAEQIAEKSIVTDARQFTRSQRQDRRQLKGEGSAAFDNDRRRWTIASSDGVVSAEFEFPREGEYLIRVYAAATRAGDEPAQLDVRLDGKSLKVFDVNSTRGAEKYEIATRAPGGKHSVSAHFLNDFYDPDEPNEDRRDRNLRIDAFELDGPLDIRAEDYPEFHRKLIHVRPDDKLDVGAAARQNLRPLINRAFRRPATDNELAIYGRLVEEAVAGGDSFEQGMQVALTAVLVSPPFLFRIEQDPARDDPTGIRELNDYELASRLSYFLWSSMPDDELFAVATAGKLRDPAVREQQVRRMLADPKSKALVENFIAQWLNLRLLDAASPDPERFSQFSPELKADMRRETELFCEAIIRDDRSILDFLGGRFTYVNGRLARHYGMEGIRGDEFRRVDFTDDRRVGVLTQASVLTFTSNPGRTSPVKRGKWIMENLLGTPPPDPPPNVPELEATAKSKPNLSLREQLAEHRSNAVCASCHKTMDQLGFGLEHFDAIGQWRDKDGMHVVDASGELPSGERFAGALELSGVLQASKTQFARCLTEKMLTFALGRGLINADRCTIDSIVANLGTKDYRFSALVVEIVSSEPFRKRRGEGELP